MQKKELPLQVSPATYGSKYAEKLILTDYLKANPTILADQLDALVHNTDQTVFITVLSTFFKIIKDNINSTKQINAVNSILKQLVPRYQELTQFKSLVIDFFNEQQTFPQQILTAINNQTAFTLTVYACYSQFSNEAKKFLQQKLIPQFEESQQFFVSGNLLFELCSLNIPNLSLKTFFQRTSSPILAHYSSQYVETMPAITIENDKKPLNISLQSVLRESDRSILSSQKKLNRTFDFFPDFNEVHASIFYISLVDPRCNLFDAIKNLDTDSKSKLFNTFKNIFSQRNIDFNKLISKFDIADMPALQDESISMLFEALAPCFEGRLIPVNQFTSQWKNGKLQYSFLVYISNHNIKGLDFNRSDRKINVSQLNLPSTLLSSFNNCWLSFEFIDRFVELSTQQQLSQNLQKIILEYPELVLAGFGQARIDKQSSNSVACDALSKLLKKPNCSQILTNLYNTTADFVRETIKRFYHLNPSKIDIIAKVTQSQYPDLSNSPDIQFATDYAFNSGKAISSFIKNYTKAHGITSLTHIVDIVKKHVTEPNQAVTIQLPCVNELFDYLAKTFDTYPIEIRALIRNAYMACVSAKTGIIQVDFKLKIPQSKLHEIKQRASMNFTKLLEGETTAEEMADDIAKSYTNDPTLFSCMTHYLLTELKFLEKHNDTTIDTLSRLTGLLVCNAGLSPKQLTTVLAFTKQAIAQPERSPSYLFARTCLSSMLPKLGEHPQFVFEILRETPLRDRDQALYEKVQKVGQAMNEPLAVNYPKRLLMHPQLQRFVNMALPPASAARELVEASEEADALRTAIARYPKQRDWLAKHVVSRVCERPGLMSTLLPVIVASDDFRRTCFEAAAYHAIRIVLDEDFDTDKGRLLRRRAVSLGRFIGKITLAENKAILARFLDLKKLLLYSFSQGKLYGTVPFVCAILSQATPFFMPPNPYTSSVLQVLAAIYLTDCLKTSIKQSIAVLFNTYKISISMFNPVPPMFPDKVRDNYDYLMIPFSLAHFVASADLEQLTNLDPSIFFKFIAPYIVVPESPSMQKNPQLREHIRQMIAQHALGHIRSEGANLAHYASSTVLELVSKDLAGSENVRDLAFDLSKQLSASLTLFTAPMRISRPLLQNLHHANETADGDWLDQVSTKNYEWISQLLRDVVKARTWKLVQEGLAQMKAGQTRAHPTPAVIQVYQEFNDISLSQQCYPAYEIQTGREKMILTEKGFDSYIDSFSSIVPFEGAQPPEGSVEEAVQAKLRQCPDFSNVEPDFVRYRSAVKSVLTRLSKAPRRDLETIFIQILEHVTMSVPASIIKRCQKYVVGWARISIRSPYAIVELIRLGLIDLADLDILYTDSLNQEPFNPKNACFIAQFLHYAIIETHSVSPRDMPSSLSIVTSLMPSQLDFPQSQQYTPIVEALASTLEEMDASEFLISSESRLKLVATDGIPANSDYKEEIDSFKALFNEENPDEDAILSQAKKLLGRGKPLFSYLLEFESEKVVVRLIQCAVELKEAEHILDPFLEALSGAIGNVGSVVSYDPRCFYNIARCMLQAILETPEDVNRFALFLHQVRPLVMPTFSLAWLELVGDRTLLAALLINKEGHPAMSILYADLCAALGKLSESDKAFDIVYKATLRLTLIIAHDFPSFFGLAATNAVLVLPYRFVQLRNILLSAPEPPEGAIVMRRAVSDDMHAMIGDGGVNSERLNAAIRQLERDISLSGAFAEVIVQHAKSGEEQQAYMCALTAMQTSFALTAAISNGLLDFVRHEGTVESISASKLLHGLTISKGVVEGHLIGEIVLRTVIERASTPSPIPSALCVLVRALLNDRSVWEMRCVTGSKSVAYFLSAAKQTFEARK